MMLKNGEINMPIIYGRELLVSQYKKSSHLEKIGIQGELSVLNYLERILLDKSIIISKPIIGHLEPDFLVMIPQEAFYIIEVKNFKLESIAHIKSNGVVTFRNNGYTNPLSQVTNHLEEFNQFMMTNYHIDVYRNIGKIVIFPSFTRVAFEKQFKQILENWTPQHRENFFKYHAFQDDFIDDVMLFKKLASCHKYYNQSFPLKTSLLLEVALTVQPRPKEESAFQFNYKEEILNESYFDEVLVALETKDERYGSHIKRIIKQMLHQELPYIYSANTASHAYLALQNLLHIVQAESSAYLSYLNELTDVRNKMLSERTRIVEAFKKDLQKEIHLFFNNQFKVMKEEVEKNTKWHTTLQDSTKKITAKLYNPMLKFAKHNETLKSTMSDLDELDDRSEVEKILQRYINEKQLKSMYDKAFRKALKNYELAWKEVIEKHTPNFSNLRTFDSVTGTFGEQTVKYKLGASEQVLGVTISSAVIGTIGLAAGWHTLAYAVANVFPPIAIFAAVATVATAVIKKDSEVENRIQQVKQVLQEYEKHIFQQMDPPRINSNKPSLFLEIEKKSDELIYTTIAHWEKQLLGDLTSSDYEMLIRKLTQYASLIEEGIIEVRNILEDE